MKLYVVFRTTKSDEPEIDSIFIFEENCDKYLEEVELAQDKWEEKNVFYSVREILTQD